MSVQKTYNMYAKGLQLKFGLQSIHMGGVLFHLFLYE